MRLALTVFALLASRCWSAESNPAVIAAQQKKCEPKLDFAQFNRVEQLFPELVACVYAGNYAKALGIAAEAKRIALHTSNRDDDLRAMLSEASVLQYMSLNEEAIQRYQSILAVPEYTSSESLAQIENNLATLYLRLGQFAEAKRLAESSVQRRQAQKDSMKEGYAQGTLAEVLVAMNELDQAAPALHNCLRIGHQHDIVALQVYCGKIQADWFYLRREYLQSLQVANTTITLAESRQMVSDLADVFLSKAKAQLALDRVRDALATAQQGIAVAEKQNDRESALPIWQFNERVYIEQKQWADAYFAKQQSENLIQQIFDQKLGNALASQRVQHETVEKEKEIVLLRKENELNQAGIAAAERQRQITLIIATFVVILAWLWLSRRMKQRDLDRARETNLELQRLHELKDELLANTSHELRTPLNGIVGLSDLLLEEYRDQMPRDVIEQVTVIRDCGAKLEEMVGTILDFSQIRAGKTLCNIVATDLRPIITAVVQLLEPLARPKQLSVQFKCSADLPLVMADGERIRQVLINLIANAIKFTEHGSVAVIATVELKDVHILVKDTGIGIPADKLKFIFEPFEQVDGSMRRRHSGVGLGLAIARALVRAHNSELQVESIVDQGSTFRFTLPLAEISPA